MLDVEVLNDPVVACVALDPVRSRLLSELREPASAAALAQRVGIKRQKVNYHLRTLEAHGLVRVHEELTWGGLTERVMIATAAAYVVSTAAIGQLAITNGHEKDRFSAAYLISLAARAIREVGHMIHKAKQSGKRLATLSIDSEIRFRSPEDRASFAEKLSNSIRQLVATYHDDSASGARPHRLIVLAHPIATKPNWEASK
jgi:DNA-binding transcriptional ArsR family regulator